MELKDRLKKARKAAGLTQKDVEKNIPNLKQSTYSELERGISKSTSRIVELASLFDVSAEWLANGSGEMRVDYKSLHDYIITGGDESPSSDEYVIIKEYDVSASCGGGSMVGDVVVKGDLLFRRDWVDGLSVKASDLAVIYAQGESMSPTVVSGRALVVDQSAIQPQSAKIYVVCIDGQLYIKRLVNMYDKWVMRSDNPNKNLYPDIEITSESMSNVDIQGRVIWQGGML